MCIVYKPVSVWQLSRLLDGLGRVQGAFPLPTYSVRVQNSVQLSVWDLLCIAPKPDPACKPGQAEKAQVLPCFCMPLDLTRSHNTPPLLCRICTPLEDLLYVIAHLLCAPPLLALSEDASINQQHTLPHLLCAAPAAAIFTTTAAQAPQSCPKPSHHVGFVAALMVRPSLE